MESFFNSLKTERTDREIYRNRTDQKATWSNIYRSALRPEMTSLDDWLH